MKTAAQYIFNCVITCASMTVSAQQFSILNYTVSDGLPSNQIVSTCEDSYGFLWIGTSNGLTRFNGKSFVNYGYTEGLPDLFVNAVYEDSYHRLWVGTLRGISELKGNRFITYPVKNHTEFMACGFKEMADHELWATTSKGVYRFTDSMWVPVNMNTGYDLTPCTQFVSTQDGLYINYGDKLVLKKKNNSIVLSQNPAGVEFNDLLEINHRLFINTRDRLYEIVQQKLKLLIDSIPARRYFSYYVDKDDNYWLLVENKGIYCYQLLPGKKKKVSFFYNMTNAIGYPFADRAHNLWLASYEGLIRIQPKSFREIYSGQNVFYQKRPYITSPGNNQLLIFGADGPQYYKNGHISNLQLPSSYSDLNNYLQDVVEGSARDDKNNVWFITRFRKLFRWNGSRLQDFSTLLPLQNEEYIYNLAVDRTTNRVFLCGDSTVLAGNERHFDAYKDKNGMTFPKSTWVLFTHTGVGIVNVFSKGIYFITRQNEIIKAPPDLDIIEKGKYTYFFEDREGYIWVSNAGKGLIRFRVTDDYKIKDVLRFNTGNGLPDNRIISMAFDTKLNIWINTNKDVAVLKNANKNFNTLDVYTIGWEQGIVHEASLTGQLTADDTGNVWVPALDRVLQFNSSQLQLTKIIPGIVIEKIMLNIKETDWTQYHDSVYSYFQIPYHPGLSYSQNSLGIQFIGTCLTDASQLEYSYRLKPISDSWSAPSSNSFVSVLNLSSGSYVFEVKARANNSKWSEPVSFSFTIRQPFWETWWFRSIIVLLASAIITGIFRYRIQQIKNQGAFKNKLQQLETKALKAQMNPHFIYNALNSIQSLVMNNQSEMAGNYISKFARLLRQILENADNNVISLDKELYSLQLYISLEKLRLNFELKYKEEIDETTSVEHERIPPLILQPFVENALWHGLSKKAGEKVLNIKIKAESEWIICEIFDNGIGREQAAEQYHIFPEGHLSKASSITMQRLLDFNQAPTISPISFVDHADEYGHATGTNCNNKNQANKLCLTYISLLLNKQGSHFTVIYLLFNKSQLNALQMILCL
jgi:ligand-binding sensor domain-containing protein